MAVELDPFELREVAAAAGGLAVLDVGEVEADLAGVDLVVARDRHERVVGEQLGDELAERGVEGGAAAGGVGEERAAAGLEVAAEQGDLLGRERERGAAVDVDRAGS